MKSLTLLPKHIYYSRDYNLITFYHQIGGDEDSEEEVGMGGPSKLDSEGEDDDKSEED